MTELIVVRHGETEWNLAARIQGHGDSSLTANGFAQADAIARRLGAEPFDLLVSSDLGRAMQTAARIAAVTGHAVLSDARFRERSFGSAEGITYAELRDRFPGAFARHLQDTDPDFQVPEAETRRRFYERIGESFEALAREQDGRRVAVVCHGGVLAALYRHILGIPAPDIVSVSIPNAAYNRVSVDASGWTIEAWGDTAHRDDIGGESAASRGSILARMS
jgi:probable phosphoglycerate mutase